jgi:hypothetical protein
MDDERFDDEVRQRNPQKKIVLSDGRELTHKIFFNTLFESGLKEPYMKEALYKLLTESPLTVELSSRDVGRTVDLERFLKKKRNISRENYEEIRVELDGVSSDDPKFYDVLVNHGECFNLK